MGIERSSPWFLLLSGAGQTEKDLNGLLANRREKFDPVTISNLSFGGQRRWFDAPIVVRIPAAKEAHAEHENKEKTR